VVLHECLTGATPFQRDTPRGFLAQKLEELPTNSRKSSTPVEVGELDGLQTLIASMTTSDPSARPASAAAVGAALARLG
jgi:hypothetical protein